MPLFPQREDEKQHLVQVRFHSANNSTDSSSLHSFESTSSSSTLADSPIALSDIDDEEKTFGLLDGPSAYTTIQPTSPPSWRKTPLTIRGLSTLLFFCLPIAILKPLLPSFLFSSPPTKIYSTSYLDGLRGVAALIVFLDHLILHWYYVLRNGYLSSPTDIYFFQLPIIRLLFAGRASVGIFFIISGFVLSHKALSQIRSGNAAAALSTLSSSVFRRSMRLYAPIMVGTFISMLLAYHGLFTPVPSRGELIPPTFPTFQEQVHDWWTHFLELAFPFWAQGLDPNLPYGPTYNGHLWTIPIEFYGSMVVFLTVLAMIGARNAAVRMGCVSVVAGWCLRRGRWDVFSFLGGVVLAEWSLIIAPKEESEQERHTLPSHEEPKTRNDEFESGPPILPSLSTLPPKSKPILRIRSRLTRFLPSRSLLQPLRKPLIAILLLTSLYLLSYPGESPTPGPYHDPLTPYIPSIYSGSFLGPEHYILSLGSLLLLFTLTLSPTLRSPFNKSFPQYLGKISYSLYIVHGLVLFTLGTYMQERWTGQVGREEWVDNGAGELVEAVVREEREGFEVGGAGYATACLLTGCVCAVLGFWAADVFWRGVDMGAVRGARWVEGLVSGKRRGTGEKR